MNESSKKRTHGPANDKPPSCNKKILGGGNEAEESLLLSHNPKLDMNICVHLTTTTSGCSETWIEAFPFPGPKIPVEQLLEICRSKFLKSKSNIWLDPNQKFCTIQPVDWDHIGGDRISSVNGNEKKQQEGEITNGNLLLVPEDDNGNLQLVNFLNLKTMGTQDILSLEINDYHARTGVKLVGLPNITTIFFHHKDKKYEFSVPDINTGTSTRTAPAHSTIFLLPSPQPTIAQIKNAILDATGIRSSSKHNTLSLVSIDPSKTWKSCANGSLLLGALGLPGPELDAELSGDMLIEVCVTTMTGKILTIECDPRNATLDDLAREVQNVEGIPVNQQRFFYAGKQLEYDTLLSDYNIQDGSIVHLVPRLRGGMYHETSAREDFEILAANKNNKDIISVNLLLPDGQERMIQVNSYEKVSHLRQQVTMACITNTEQGPESEDEDNIEKGGNNEDKTDVLEGVDDSKEGGNNEDEKDELEGVDDRIKRLREELLDAELEKERLIRRRHCETKREDFLIQMLRREAEMRKSPGAQQAMEKAEESVESEWMDVVANVQKSVVQEFDRAHASSNENGDNDNIPSISVHDLRLAALRHPEIAFWVKFNRARQGTLRVGEEAPDVLLVQANSGEETTLLNRTTKGKPCVIVAGSLS